MANPLASYVEKFILNNENQEHQIEDEGNEETLATNVTQSLDEEVKQRNVISKLRLQNAELLDEKDPRYEGKKISRQDIGSIDHPLYDEDFARLIKKQSFEDKFKDSGDDSEDNDLDVNYDSLGKYKSYIDNDDAEDYSKFLGDDEGSDKQSEEYEEGDYDPEENNLSHKDISKQSHINQEESDEGPKPLIHTLSAAAKDQYEKALAVQSQSRTYDVLFEARIGLQKSLSLANQLPQHEAFEAFRNNREYPKYKHKLSVARKGVKSLLKEILDLQELLSKRHSETEHMFHKSEEAAIIDSKDDDDDFALEDETSSSNLKRKRTVAAWEGVLEKRLKATQEFTEETLMKWHTKAKFLSDRRNRGFDAFDISPLQMIDNILSQKKELIERTQKVSVARGNMKTILGKPQDENCSVESYFDPEIFDDGDFYSRLLETMLKSKMSKSDDMSRTSKTWMDVQKLRRKAKYASVGGVYRKNQVNYDPIPRLKQFMAPCKPPEMDDEAINLLFSSLFGQKNIIQSEMTH